MRTKYNRIRFFEEWLSAAEIARRHGLSVPTILKRYALGLQNHELVAEPGALPRAPDGQGRRYRSQRIPTVLQANYQLRRAKAGVTMAFERLANAKAMGESRATLTRLEKLLRRAEQRRFFCTEMARTAEELAKERENAA